MLQRPNYGLNLKGLQKLKETSDLFYQETLGYKPENTSLKILNNSNEWKNYCNSIAENSDKQGIYSPRNQTSAFPSFIKNAPLSLFHEYFGHGLYCEKSLKGQELVNLEKKLLQEEKQEFQGRSFSLEDIKKFRNNNKTYQELKQFQKENLGIYEGFAILTEYILSDKFDIKELFEKKYDDLSQENKQAVDNIINFNKTYGDLASFYNFGLKKIQNKERLFRLSDGLFGKKMNDIPLILHFGSGKPYSDIDLFVASDNVSPFFSEWIDVRAYRLKDIEKNIQKLDPKITDPFIMGKIIYGNPEYRGNIQRKIKKQPIKKEAIDYNLEMWNYYKKRSQDKSLSKRFRDKNIRSAKTYLTNAIALKRNKKLLTFSNLVDYSHLLSSNESFKELKGGIE